MKSLKITLMLTALIAVFVITVSGQSSQKDQVQNTDETFKTEKKLHKKGFAGVDKKKKDRPNSHA